MGNKSPLFDQSDCSIHKCCALIQALLWRKLGCIVRFIDIMVRICSHRQGELALV